MSTNAGEPAIRRSKRQRIIAFFSERLDEEYGSNHLHGVYGTAFRARVSEINRDPTSTITIRNKTISGDTEERSFYWAERRPPSTVADREVDRLFPDDAPLRHLDLG